MGLALRLLAGGGEAEPAVFGGKQGFEKGAELVVEDAGGGQRLAREEAERLGADDVQVFDEGFISNGQAGTPLLFKRHAEGREGVCGGDD